MIKEIVRCKEWWLQAMIWVVALGEGEGVEEVRDIEDKNETSGDFRKMENMIEKMKEKNSIST